MSLLRFVGIGRTHLKLQHFKVSARCVSTGHNCGIRGVALIKLQRKQAKPHLQSLVNDISESVVSELGDITGQ